MVVIGVLSLQGSFKEHLAHLRKVEGVQGIPVKSINDLNQVDALIIPGGESTTMAMLLKTYNMISPLREKISQGFPVWGTCAGMILLANNIEGEEKHIGGLNISVKRNAFGRQLGSFNTKLHLSKVSSKALELVFIRGPVVTEVFPNTEVIAEYNNHILGVREGNIIATSFHPELTESIEFHQYFLGIVNDHISSLH